MIFINGVYFFSLCVVILVINYSKAIRLTEVLYSTSISNAAIKIVSDFYKPRTSNVFVSYGCFDAENDKTLTDIVDNVLVRTSSDVSYIVEEKINNNTISNVRFYNIMFVDSYEGFS
jgi:predicted mannosyl-3-phosphoglycerate phosphatase (HAD superfamily)